MKWYINDITSAAFHEEGYLQFHLSIGHVHDEDRTLLEEQHSFEELKYGRWSILLLM